METLSAPLPLPTTLGYTVFSKSGCVFCDKVKTLLETSGRERERDVTVINCDMFLVGDVRDQFLQHIATLTSTANTKIRFPLVFHNAVFVGGYMDTREYIDNGSDDF